ncbi:MAG: histidine kinase N-terminal 7TM domain-containing protein, partial [Dehalococcoidia bacterium]
MSIYLLLPLVALGANLSLALFAWRGQWHAKGGRPFVLFLLSMAMWGGLLYMMRSSVSLTDAYFWDKLVFVDLALTTVLFLHFTYSFAGLAPAKLVMPVA